MSPGVEGVLCFYCSKAFYSETSPLAKNADSAFISSGFKNWKKALERFTVHERSDSHKTAMTTHIYEDRSVQVQLSSVSVKQQGDVFSKSLVLCRYWLGRAYLLGAMW